MELGVYSLLPTPYYRAGTMAPTRCARSERTTARKGCERLLPEETDSSGSLELMCRVTWEDCKSSRTNYLLRTTYYLLLTTYYVLRTTYYLLLTTYYVLLSTYCLLLTTYYLLLTTYYLVLTT